MTEKKHAIVILETQQDDMGNYIPCIVKEGETGYHPTDWKWGTDLKEAEALADDYNKKLGLTEEEAYTIILQSMRPTHRKLTEQERDRMINMHASHPLTYQPEIDDPLIELGLVQMWDETDDAVEPNWNVKIFAENGAISNEWYDWE